MKIVVLFTRVIGKGLVVRPMKSFPFLGSFFDFIKFRFLIRSKGKFKILPFVGIVSDFFGII